MQFLDSQLYTFIVVTVVLTITPGVDTVVVLRNVLRGGKSDGIITGLGICSGLFIHASFSALGISIILMQSAVFFKCIKTIGAFYLIWLGLGGIYQAWKNINPIRTKNSHHQGPKRTAYQKSFREGFFSNILNPKPAIFYLAFFPQFINQNDPIFLKSMVLTSLQFIIGVAWLSFLSLLIFKIKAFLEKPLFNRVLNAVTGSILVALGLKLGMEK